MRRDVFQAIADPTRRAIINMISKESLNLNAVADHFDISRPAISKHIKILTECGLIVIRQQGRERYCEAKLKKLNEVSAWVEQYKTFWNAKLDALENYLTDVQTKKNKNVKRNSNNGCTGDHYHPFIISTQRTGMGCMDKTGAPGTLVRTRWFQHYQS
jgi:DNA-binding transcriptional ArsR family regulator